jgi:hypothetical protein
MSNDQSRETTINETIKRMKTASATAGYADQHQHKACELPLYGTRGTYARLSTSNSHQKSPESAPFPKCNIPESQFVAADDYLSDAARGKNVSGPTNNGRSRSLGSIKHVREWLPAVDS